VSAVLPFVEVNESGGAGSRGDEEEEEKEEEKEEEGGEGEWEDVVQFCHDEVMEFS
jgi:hypothetical protein